MKNAKRALARPLRVDRLDVADVHRGRRRARASARRAGARLERSASAWWTWRAAASIMPVSLSSGFSFARIPPVGQDGVDVAASRAPCGRRRRQRLHLDLGVEAAAPRAPRPGRSAELASVTAIVNFGGPPDAQQRRDHRDEHDDHHCHARRDQERLLARALRHLAAARPARRPRASSRRHRLAEQVAQRRPLEREVRTVPAARAASSTASGPAPSSQRDQHAVAARGRPPRRPARRRATPRPRRPAPPRARSPARAAVAQLVDPPGQRPAGRP